ncbi:beta-lactamase transpeptidase [Fusarium phyllophilum]|uniref:Beta-lactamase transpeptidase n=1 Tax=Fusarium phyllophilum TaxID=47803 RepID=A0A8H5NFI5_9HYPO|nr:beta-lactamase transpeptidase [Fusarium phyllophilum]
MENKYQVISLPSTLTWEEIFHLAMTDIQQVCSISGTPGFEIRVLDRNGKTAGQYLCFRDVNQEPQPDADTVFKIGSMCRGFTALAITALVTDGRFIGMTVLTLFSTTFVTPMLLIYLAHHANGPFATTLVVMRVHLMPEFTKIIVLGNSLCHCDATDWSAQILTQVFLSGGIDRPFSDLFYCCIFTSGNPLWN